MVTAQKMEVALEAYKSSQHSEDRLSKRETSRRYKIPWSSFRDCTNGRKPGSRRGAPCALTPTEEDAIVQGLLDLAAAGFPATRWKLKLLAMDIARDGRKHPFGANGPSDKWVSGFLSRHSDRLSMRKSRIIDASRVHAFDIDDINCFFEEYEQYVHKHQLPPTRIYNCDESGIDPRGGETFKVIAARGAKDVCEKRGDNRENTTVLMAVSASGVIIPPVFLFRGKLFSSNLLANGPLGCKGTVTENAFIDTPTFEFWIDHFVENIPPARPVLLILDNHKAHVALSVLEKCRSYQIDVLALPPHTTHILQPCDDGCFRSFKAEWRKQIQKWSADTKGASLPRSMVAKTVRDTMNTAWSPGVITGSWASTGLWPIDRKRATRKTMPGVNTKSNSAYGVYEIEHDPLPLDSFSGRDLRRLSRDGIDLKAFRGYSITRMSVGSSPPKKHDERVLIKPTRLLTHEDCMAELRLRENERIDKERQRDEKRRLALEKKKNKEAQKIQKREEREMLKRARVTKKEALAAKKAKLAAEKAVRPPLKARIRRSKTGPGSATAQVEVSRDNSRSGVDDEERCVGLPTAMATHSDKACVAPIESQDQSLALGRLLSSIGSAQGANGTRIDYIDI